MPHCARIKPVTSEPTLSSSPEHAASPALQVSLRTENCAAERRITPSSILGQRNWQPFLETFRNDRRPLFLCPISASASDCEYLNARGCNNVRLRHVLMFRDMCRSSLESRVSRLETGQKRGDDSDYARRDDLLYALPLGSCASAMTGASRSTSTPWNAASARSLSIERPRVHDR